MPTAHDFGVILMLSMATVAAFGVIVAAICLVVSVVIDALRSLRGKRTRYRSES